MNHLTRAALLLVSIAILPACDEEETTIINQAAGPTGPTLPPGALASGTLLILSDRGTLLNTSSGELGTIYYDVALGGTVAAGESIVAIDYRPANGVLYGLSNQGRLYTVNPATGGCVAVNLTPIMAFTGTRFGMDFNPTVDRLRIVSDADENVRVNADTGALVQVDTPLSPASDALAIAYTNNFSGATVTSLFLMDAATSSLYRLDNPNTGALTLVGAYGAGTDQAGFDISADNVALVARSGGGFPSVFRIDLFSGVASGLFNIDTNFAVRGLAIVP
ncbi:MAG TPA: DUF4394 domain-containing protein [Planctomycetota bacterium]